MVIPTGQSEVEEAEHGKCGMETQVGRTSAAGRAVRTSGGTGLWELGKTQPELCSPCFCQGSGESQPSSIIRTIEGRNYRIKIKKWSMMIETSPEGRGAKEGEKGKKSCL